jgi:hypothetical protein
VKNALMIVIGVFAIFFGLYSNVTGKWEELWLRLWSTTIYLWLCDWMLFHDCWPIYRIFIKSYPGLVPRNKKAKVNAKHLHLVSKDASVL